MRIELNGFTIKQLNDGRYHARNEALDVEFIIDDLDDLSAAIETVNS